MCKDVSCSFITYSILSYVIVLTASILNMIFSINNNQGDAEAFKEVNLTDKYKTFSELFLVDIEFGKVHSNKSYYNSVLTIKELCYRGICILNSESIINKNCSEACFEESHTCFNEEKKCLNNICLEIYNFYEGSGCRIYNRIEKWRDTEMYNYSKRFEIKPYTQIKAKDEICDKGYRRCGKINKEEDFLCLKEEENSDFECPINKIVILSNNKTPSDNYKYKKYKIGEKNIFVTNESTNDYLISDLFINFDNYTDDSNYQLIDKESYLNFSRYNNLSYEPIKEYPPRVKLNAVQYHSGFTAKEMRKFQEMFLKRSEMYSHEKIEEMNLNVKSCKNLLMGLGLGALASIGGVGFYFIIFYPASGCGRVCEGKCNCFLCYDITPMKRVLTFYIVFFPCILLSFISFIITLAKVFIYKKYSSMEYIVEYKNYEIDKYSSYKKEELSYIFDNSIFYNYAQFINLLIIILTVIVYPIIIKFTSPDDDSYNEIMSYSLNKKKSKNNNKNYNYGAKCMENKFKITPEYDSNNFYPTNSGNYGAPQPVYNNQSYHGETPFYQ